MLFRSLPVPGPGFDGSEQQTEETENSEADSELLPTEEVTASAFFEYRAEVKNPLPMINQSGYLTIKDYDRDVLLYTLGFPNDEVRYGFLNFLVPYYTEVTDDETGFHIAKFMRELRSGDVDAFMERLKVFFAGIPYELSNNTERHYQAIFYVVFTLLGQFVQAEVRSARGRADAVVQTKDVVYVFEFKLNGSAEDALKQIDERGYLIPIVHRKGSLPRHECQRVIPQYTSPHSVSPC